jgi:purine-binding chemotaxis protein CheW
MNNVTAKADHTNVLQKIPEGKYLTFTLAEQDYGITILKVKEIIGMIAITKIPRTPQHVKGVINLRGRVIPVIDLRLKFDLPAIDYTERTCVIVVEIAGRDKKITLGIVVDSVSEVLNIKSTDVEETPCFGTRLNTDFILGMAKLSGGVKILLEIDRVITVEDADVIAQAA